MTPAIAGASPAAAALWPQQQQNRADTDRTSRSMRCSLRNGRQSGRAVPVAVRLACSCRQISGKQEQDIPVPWTHSVPCTHSSGIPDPNAVEIPFIPEHSSHTHRQTGRPLRSPWWQAVEKRCSLHWPDRRGTGSNVPCALNSGPIGHQSY